MKVPNANAAEIDDSKVRNYLLSPTHPVGRYKARFFGSIGYTQEDTERLAAGLRAVLANEVSDTIESEFGTKFVVRGQLEPLAGSATAIVTVWIIRAGEDIPRLVTAYPGDGDED